MFATIAGLTAIGVEVGQGSKPVAVPPILAEAAPIEDSGRVLSD